MSKIEWTHRPGTKSEVWNMIRGCSLKSRGCENCYAMHFAHRFSQPGGPFEGLTRNTNSGVKWTGKIKLMPEMLCIPLRWKKPRTCFVNSMTDLFHEDVPFDFIDNVFAVMDCCPEDTFIILTKRADRMFQYYQEQRSWRVGQLKISYDDKDYDLSGWPLKNVWILVSVEDQKTANERIPHLIQCPAQVRGISYEPALGPLNLPNNFSPQDLKKIHWIIAGGESGNKARPAHPDWYRFVRDTCKSFGIAYFFKQWGKYAPTEVATKLLKPDQALGVFNSVYVYRDGTSSPRHETDYRDIDNDLCEWMHAVGKHQSGNLLDGVQHLEFPA